MDDTPIAVGVDGCRSGWIAALSLDTRAGRRTTTLKHFTTVRDSASWRESLDDRVFVAIDVPIGISESTRYRRCDVEARSRLGERRSSVFMPPGRYLLEATDYAEARRLVEERRRDEPGANGIGARAWGIVPKIREADELLHAEAECKSWLLEVHPELCFFAWSDNRPLRGKRTAGGQVQRLGLVRRTFPDVECSILEDLGSAAKVDLTDIPDAYAAL